MTNHRHVADLLAYLCARYPHKSELSNARLTKLVYLADWKSVQDSGRQLTPIDWVFYNYGPWVPSVIDAAKMDDRFAVSSGVNAYGSPRLTVAVKPEVAANADSLVDRRTAAILDLVIAETEGMYFNPFIRYVYGTLPVRITPKGQPLPLTEIIRDHPDAATSLPDAVVRRVLSARQYVHLRTRIGQLTADQLLDPSWADRAEILPKTALPNTASIRQVSIAPDMKVSVEGPNVLRIVTSGTADGVAEIDMSAATPSGWSRDDDDREDTAQHLHRAWSMSVNATAASHGDDFTVAVHRITLT